MGGSGETGVVVAREPTPPYERTFELPEQTRTNRKVQRLTLRGRVTISMELTSPRVWERWDGHVTTYRHASLPVPVWHVHVGRSRGLGLMKQMLGWNDVHEADPDLEAAIDRALERTAPHRVYLFDHVYEHRYWTHDFAHMAGRIGGDNTCMEPTPFGMAGDPTT